MIRWLGLLALVIFLPGVATCDRATEADRRLNWQTHKAGSLIKEKAVDPEVKQAGADVEANTKVTQVTLGGDPEKKEDYSPPKSEEIRNVKIEEQKSSGLLGVLKWLGLGALGIAIPLIQRAATAYFPWLGGPIAIAGDATMKAVAKSREQSTVTGGVDSIPVSVLDDFLKNEQLRAGVAAWAKPYVKKLEENLRLDPDKV